MQQTTHHYLVLILLLLLASTQSDVVAQESNFLTDFKARWETSHKYMLLVAEALPENDYAFKPTPEEMTFAQQLMHIAAVVDWHAFSKADGQEYQPRWEDFKAEGRSKKEMIEMINKEFERAARLIDTFNTKRLEETGNYAKFTRTRRQFFMLMADHVTHHRAQMLVYLRLKGIAPPSYIDFQ